MIQPKSRREGGWGGGGGQGYERPAKEGFYFRYNMNG